MSGLAARGRAVDRAAGHAGANLAMLRRVALSLLKRADTKGTLPTRRMKAAWDDDFMLKVLQGITDN